MMDDVIREIVSAISATGNTVYFGKSPVKYPKIDGSLTQIAGGSCEAKYRLTLDFWGNDGVFIDAINTADVVKAAISYGKVKTASGYLAIYHDGSRYSVPEKDNEKIVHIVDNYAVYYYSGTEE